MKQNFTNEEVLAIFNAFGSKFNVRVNKAGNIDLVNSNRTNNLEHFVLYLTSNNRYLWRRWFDTCYCYPLNMRGRKRVGPIHKEVYDGKHYYWYNRSWDIRNCEFDTVNEAIEYFKNYAKKFHNIEC